MVQRCLEPGGGSPQGKGHGCLLVGPDVGVKTVEHSRGCFMPDLTPRLSPVILVLKCSFVKWSLMIGGFSVSFWLFLFKKKKKSIAHRWALNALEYVSRKCGVSFLVTAWCTELGDGLVSSLYRGEEKGSSFMSCY